MDGLPSSVAVEEATIAAGVRWAEEVVPLLAALFSASSVCFLRYEPGTTYATTYYTTTHTTTHTTTYYSCYVLHHYYTTTTPLLTPLPTTSLPTYTNAYYINYLLHLQLERY